MHVHLLLVPMFVILTPKYVFESYSYFINTEYKIPNIFPPNLRRYFCAPAFP